MAERKIAIITDSTCDIPRDLIECYGIRVIPQIVIWGDQQYRDRVTIQPEEFYQRLQTDPVRPTTAQVSEQDFLNRTERPGVVRVFGVGSFVYFLRQSV